MQCESLLEEHESDIEDWYFKLGGEVPLKNFLCSQNVLKDDSDSCLWELEDDKKSGTDPKAGIERVETDQKDKDEL